MLRRNAVRMKEIFRYDNHCRQLPVEEVKCRLRNREPHVVRFKMDRHSTSFTVLLVN